MPHITTNPAFLRPQAMKVSPGGITTVLRMLQAAFAIVNTGLSAYVVWWWNIVSPAPAQFNFILFCSAWTICAILFLNIGPHYFPKMGETMILLGIETVTLLLWFGGFIALSVYLAIVLKNGCRGHVCADVKAMTAVSVFEWLLFTATLMLTVVNGIRARILRRARTIPTEHIEAYNLSSRDHKTSPVVVKEEP